MVALGLAAALTFGGGVRADQNADGTRSIDASSATSGVLSNVAVEAGGTAALPALDAAAVVGTSLGSVVPESTSQSGVRSLGAAALAGVTLTNPAVEANQAEGIRSLGASSVAGGAFTAVAAESSDDSGLRSLSPGSLSGGSFGGPATESTSAVTGRSIAVEAVISGRFSSFAVEAARQESNDEEIPTLDPASLSGEALTNAGVQTESNPDEGLRSLDASSVISGGLTQPARETTETDGGRNLTAVEATGGTLGGGPSDEAMPVGIRSLGPQIVSGESFGGGGSSESTEAEGIRSLSPFGLTSETIG